MRYSLAGRSLSSHTLPSSVAAVQFLPTIRPQICEARCPHLIALQGHAFAPAGGPRAPRTSTSSPSVQLCAAGCCLADSQQLAHRLQMSASRSLAAQSKCKFAQPIVWMHACTLSLSLTVSVSLCQSLSVSVGLCRSLSVCLCLVVRVNL